jgi:hypothetical protein
MLDVSEQPFVFVTMHQYCPEVRATIQRAVSPVFHTYFVKPIGAQIVISPVGQKVVGPETLSVALGRAFTVMLIALRTVQPKLFVSATVSVAEPGSVHSTATFGVP